MSNVSLTRRRFLKAAGLGSIALASGRIAAFAGNPKRPNILLITADDMNWNAPGCFGGRTTEITPNIDRLASEGIRFEHAHITIAVCQPSRSALMTGRYPHRNGAEGFEPIDVSVPTLEEQLHDAGYFNGILGKVSHLAPPTKFKWDMAHDANELGNGRNPQLYYKYARGFFGQAANQGRPFFLMANSHDPHRPFHGSDQEQKSFAGAIKDIPAPSRLYKPEDIEVPGFLPELPDVRKEVSQYYCSVRRCDDTVGEVLRALRESGQADNTLIMFLSDNGMSFPYSKTNCYLNSTRTPWIAVWPGKVKPDAVDDKHFISGIDFMPTVLDAAGLAAPKGMDGTSFLPVLLGKSQPQRDKVFTQFHETSARGRFPMRCVQNQRYGYIFNAWSDGKRIFRNESQSGLTFNAMKAGAQTNEAVAARVKFFLYRTVEEFYDFQKDPDALHNLIDEPSYKEEIDAMRKELLAWMKQTGDPALEAFENRTSPSALQKFMAEQEARANPPKQAGQKKKARKAVSDE